LTRPGKKGVQIGFKVEQKFMKYLRISKMSLENLYPAKATKGKEELCVKMM